MRILAKQSRGINLKFEHTDIVQHKLPPKVHYKNEETFF